MGPKKAPLIELLQRVPETTRARVDEPDGMGSVLIPVGRYCIDAAAELRRLHAEVERLREEHDEDQRVIAVWRGRCERLEAEVERLRGKEEA